ncbi:rRNA methyltransferase 1, mitochondrial isoform X2 [Anguilla anguilla]|uniref:rRNA methyltransferase 1, mitochondrial isoform X2 n=1 Tax=Anguilla anguilla TaxID=7936 RepID=UPI0015B0869B|nr:rRNA methyltransferase 1, mitochondrial isoform X2 [Anguilla anguilla]
MRLSQWIYRCARYTGDAILRSGVVGRPQRRFYRCSVMLLSSDDDGSELAEGRGRSVPGPGSARVAPPGKPLGAGGGKAAKRRPAKPENQAKQAGSEPGLRPKSRLSLDLQRLSQDDLAEAEPEADGGQAGVRRRTEVLFGAAPCLLALARGRRVMHRLFVKGNGAPQRPALQQASEEARRRMVPIQPASRKELDGLCSGRVHQGLCLEASPLEYLTDEGDAGAAGDHSEPPLWLVLEGVQDPMNLGAILRSAYFLGVDRIVSSIRNSCPLTPVVSKASSGVMEIVEVYGYENLADMLKSKVGQGWQVIGTVGAAEVGVDVPVHHCSDFVLTTPTLLLIGGEGPGLSPDLQRLCHALLTIPPCRELHPAVESLNVSVATGILVHSLLSSRTKGRR